jgi:hypothetical protein
MNNKLTRQQACEELARRMGWAEIENGTGIPPHENRVQSIPDYFADHAAAHELVVWFASLDTFQSVKFLNRITDILQDAEDQAVPDRSRRRHSTYLALLATPAEKTRAACDVLGIELEESE